MAAFVQMVFTFLEGPGGSVLLLVSTVLTLTGFMNLVIQVMQPKVKRKRPLSFHIWLALIPFAFFTFIILLLERPFATAAGIDGTIALTGSAVLLLLSAFFTLIGSVNLLIQLKRKGPLLFHLKFALVPLLLLLLILASRSLASCPGFECGSEVTQSQTHTQAMRVSLQ